MSHLLPSDKIYITKSPIAGRGVFAKVPIKKGEVIEICPVIIIPNAEADQINPDLMRYVFRWKTARDDTTAIVMGFGSFYNHSTSPNAAHHQSILERTMTFFALRDIEKDEEITHDYGYTIAPEDVRK